jgi:peptidoglycan hydrolase CwlO-like protein
MQSLSVIGGLPTAALICGLIFGVLTLGCACFMIIKDQWLSGASILLAILGTSLLVISIWQSRSGNINELAETQYEQQIKALTNKQEQIKQWLTKVQKKTEQYAGQIQEIRDGQRQVSDSYSTRLTEQGRLLDHMVTQIAQIRVDFAAMSADHIKQMENVAQQRQALATQLDRMSTAHQRDLKSLQEDIEAVSSPGQELNLIRAATQYELSSLRREVDQLQENIRQLQGRRYRAP